jgi:DnaJ-class molecular chaperone
MTEGQYNHWKPQMVKYEEEQLRLSRISGSVQCPFCRGSKTTPFTRQGQSQDCEECDNNGMIKNRRLAELDLI